MHRHACARTHTHAAHTAPENRSASAPPWGPPPRTPRGFLLHAGPGPAGQRRTEPGQRDLHFLGHVSERKRCLFFPEVEVLLHKTLDKTGLLQRHFILTAERKQSLLKKQLLILSIPE